MPGQRLQRWSIIQVTLGQRFLDTMYVLHKETVYNHIIPPN